MNAKTIVTVVLLVFVAVSVGHLIIRETGGRPAETMTQTQGEPAASDQKEHAPSAATEKQAESKVIVYYFHGNVRCVTCRTIQAYAKEAIETGFPEALRDGHLEWRVVNVDEPDNDHYVQDFELTTRSVVLERLAAGKRQEWKDLRRVWELVRGDKKAFLSYVQDEARAYLEAAGK